MQSEQPLYIEAAELAEMPFPQAAEESDLDGCGGSAGGGGSLASWPRASLVAKRLVWQRRSYCREPKPPSAHRFQSGSCRLPN